MKINYSFCLAMSKRYVYYSSKITLVRENILQQNRLFVDIQKLLSVCPEVRATSKVCHDLKTIALSWSAVFPQGHNCRFDETVVICGIRAGWNTARTASGLSGVVCNTCNYSAVRVALLHYTTRYVPNFCIHNTRPNVQSVVHIQRTRVELNTTLSTVYAIVCVSF